VKEIKMRIFTSGILMHKGKILILNRGPNTPRYPNMWDSIGGHLNENENVEDCMIREAKEECGLDVKIRKAGKIYEYYDDYGKAVVIPFLLESNSKRVKLSFEHVECKWIEPKELKNYDCVPDLIEDVKIFRLI
jgi:8-oxo-dGTP diphosphatase